MNNCHPDRNPGSCKSVGNDCWVYGFEQVCWCGKPGIAGLLASLTCAHGSTPLICNVEWSLLISLRTSKQRRPLNFTSGSSQPALSTILHRAGVLCGTLRARSVNWRCKQNYPYQLYTSTCSICFARVLALSALHTCTGLLALYEY